MGLTGLGRPTSEPGRRVVARAPVRICDVGGWTDTWFAPPPGRVCSLAAGPGVEVTATLVDRVPGRPPVRLRAPDIAVVLDVGPDPDPVIGWDRPAIDDHPLLLHAVGAALGPIGLPADLGIELDVTSAVPPGSSLGTSSAVMVALIAAIEALLLGHPDEAEGARPVADLPRRAHQIEVDRAGRQAGVQDAWPAALGGAVQLVIDRFPEVRWRHLQLGEHTWQELHHRLVTVAVGAHDSSEVHREVIASIAGGARAAARVVLERLSALADEAAQALTTGDIDRWGEVLQTSTDVQAGLHPGLVGDAHRHAIEVAASLGCGGWKVNGAGGDGGSLTVVAPFGRVEDVRAALAEGDPSWQVLDLRVPAAGVTVHDETAAGGSPDA